MVRTESPICDFDLPAIEFELKGIDGKFYDLNSLKGPNGLLVMFICNHCPYVKSIIDQIIIDTKELAELGVNSVGIMSNDPNEYEEDSFENMKKT
jgi:peroxiredoxin